MTLTAVKFMFYRKIYGVGLGKGTTTGVFGKKLYSANASEKKQQRNKPLISIQDSGQQYDRLFETFT